MAKSLSASEMLGRTHRAEKAVPSPAAQAELLVAGSPSYTEDQASSNHSDQTPSNRVVVKYEKTSAFLTPEQRQWLKATIRGLPVEIEGLSASDVIRLAIDQLRDAVDDGLPLLELLTSRAHAEAERFNGRRNRGLPKRLSD